MKYFKTLQTKVKLPEYHLDYDKSQLILIKNLEDLGYKNFNDFKIINERGYSTKATIRLIKSKIKKDSKVLEVLKNFLLTEEKYNNLNSREKMYYTTLNNETAMEL